jgi:acyl-CoA synthetase (AMP-forming)/AMP-acid ligase II
MIFESIKNQSYEIGQKTAIICKDKQYTYSELVESVEKLAGVLSTAIYPGETILFASEKEYHYVRMILACDILGVTFVPTKPNPSVEELDWMVSETSPDHIIMNEEDALALSPHDKALLYTIKHDSIYVVLFTNESTLESKAAAHTGAGCFLSCLNSIILHNIKPEDVVISQSSPSTIDGLFLYTLPGLIKGCTVIMEQFNPSSFPVLCEEHKPTIGTIVSDMVPTIKNLKDMSHWKELSIDSTIISEEIIDTLFKKGVPAIRSLYGHTETHIPSFTFLIKPDTKHKLQLECNEQYEYKLDRYNRLWIKSPLLMTEYVNTNGEFDSENYWCTGDVFERKHNKLFYKSIYK